MFIAQEKNLKLNIMNFTHIDFGDIRGTLIDDNPWFVGKDIAEALGYSRTADAIASHVDVDDKGVGKVPTPGGTQDMMLINESGLYSLIFSSRLESAKKFRKWVTRQVLSSIRRYGGYVDGKNKNIRELTKCSYNALEAVTEVLVKFFKGRYNIDVEEIHRILSSKVNKLAGIPNGHRDAADIIGLIKLDCVQSSFVETISMGIVNGRDFSDIINSCDDNAEKDLKRFSFEVVPAENVLIK